MNYKIKYLQPLGDSNCLMYGLANILDEKGLISESVLNWYKKVPPFNLENINVVLTKMNFDFRSRVIACVPIDNGFGGIVKEQLQSKAIFEGLEQMEDDYRVQLWLVEDAFTQSSSTIKGLHAVFILLGAKECIKVDPRLSEATSYPTYSAMLEGVLGDTTVKVYAVLELTDETGFYAFVIPKEFLEATFK